MLRLAAILAILILPSAALAQGYRSLSGTVAYPERIALPPEAMVLVEVLGPDLTLVAEARVATEGRQVPIPFTLEIPEGAEGDLRAGIVAGGRVMWLGEPVAIAADAGRDLGEIRLWRHPAQGFDLDLRCGDRMVRVGFAGEAAVLDTGAERLLLAPVPSASGARYAAADDPGTVFWSQGDEAMVTLAGEALEPCRIALPRGAAVYRAGGNEPFWSITLAEGELRLFRLGMEDLALPVTGTTLTEAGEIMVTAADDARALRAVMMRQLATCRDSMTGMPYPETVEVSMGDHAITGCGGAPADLLLGRTWVLEDVAGGGIIDSTRLTLGFGTDERVAGSGGCNRWFAGYALTGEGLTIGQAGSTMMACPDAIMDQERRFFEALGRVTGFDIDATGALVLTAGEEPVLTARVATDGSTP